MNSSASKIQKDLVYLLKIQSIKCKPAYKFDENWIEILYEFIYYLS